MRLERGDFTGKEVSERESLDGKEHPGWVPFSQGSDLEGPSPVLGKGVHQVDGGSSLWPPRCLVICELQERASWCSCLSGLGA